MTCTPQCNTPRPVVQKAVPQLISAAGDCFYCVAVATPITAAPEKATPPPVPLPGVAAESIPETRRYRLKNKLLGPPLVTEQLATERLSKAIALGVLAPDCISSSAYGTEEMLTQLVPYVGLAAFTLVVPITLAILGVLFFVTLSYLEVIQLYTKAGGSYVVARDNFGPSIAQIAAVALLIDYTVTVAVQTSAGTAALTSAVPSLAQVHRRDHGGRGPRSSSTATCAASARPGATSPSRPTSSSSRWRRSSSSASSRRHSARCTTSPCRRRTSSTAGRSAHPATAG